MSAKLWLLALAPRPEDRAAGARLEDRQTAPAVQEPAERTTALRAAVEAAAAPGRDEGPAASR